jgi:hypothetical protein
LFATVLNAIEGGLWAVTYWLLGILPDTACAMLYSIGAMTSYGYAGLALEERFG